MGETETYRNPIIILVAYVKISLPRLILWTFLILNGH